MARKPVKPLPSDSQKKILGKYDTYSALTVGERLRLSRSALGFTQDQFASQLSVKREAYSQYETGKREPPPAIAIEMFRAYRLDLNWIYMGDASSLPFNIREAIYLKWNKN